MTTSDPAPAPIVSALYREACLELFRAYGVAARPVDRPSWRSRQSIASAIVLLGITSDVLTLNSVLTVEATLLAATYPASGFTTTDDLEDWCRELSNQLGGRLKSKLLRLGCQVMLGLATVIRGDPCHALASPDAEIEDFFFPAPAAALGASLAMRFAPGCLLGAGDSRDAEEAQLEGSQVLFF